MGQQKVFKKPAIAIDRQIELLKNRQLFIDNLSSANHFLRTIGYYRLMAYFQPFLLVQTNPEKQFKPNASFSDILHLYIFDRELRLLVTDALERIEVALRASISNSMSVRHGSHWYLKRDLFQNHNRHAAFLKEAFTHLARSKEDFIKSYYDNYDHPTHPPSWMVMECLSFGTISQVYNNLKDRSMRKAVGDIFGQYSEVIKSWMRALTFTRNVCAHHARLWNRFFISTPKSISIPVNTEKNDSPFLMQAYIIIQLMDAIAPGNHWKDRLMLLLEEHETLIDFQCMGFDANWRDSALWGL